jgi:hypothetical protein
MLLDPFLYDFVADHQRALRKAAEQATSWGISSEVRPQSRRPRSLSRALWFFNLADHDSRTSAWGPVRRCRGASGLQDRGERDRAEDPRRTWPTDTGSGASDHAA